MTLDRRRMIGSGAALAALAGLSGAPALAAGFRQQLGPRSRMVLVNDLSGDVDGLFATVHAILASSSQLSRIVATSTFNTMVSGETVDHAVELANEILTLMGRSGQVPVHGGAAHRLTSLNTPVSSAGSQAIIDEAMRTDTALPLFVAVGGGLTEVASALMLEPRIAGKFTLVWIGGDAWPGGGTGEYNFTIDPLAAQYVYNHSQVPIWQIPRSVYASCMVTLDELQISVAPCGAIGKWLYDKVVHFADGFGGILNTGETWTLGDNPLVLLTSLTDWPPSNQKLPLEYLRTGSSQYDDVIAPLLNADGTFTPRSEGRRIRIYRSADVRMMLGDLFAKLRINFLDPA
jgi:purine nucleosidase